DVDSCVVLQRHIADDHEIAAPDVENGANPMFFDYSPNPPNFQILVFSTRSETGSPLEIGSVSVVPELGVVEASLCVPFCPSHVDRNLKGIADLPQDLIGSVISRPQEPPLFIEAMMVME